MGLYDELEQKLLKATELNKLDWQRNVVVGMQVILPTAQVVTVTKDSLTINPDGEKQEISSGLWYAIKAYLERKTRAKAHRYNVVFKPQLILPDVEVSTSVTD